MARSPKGPVSIYFAEGVLSLLDRLAKKARRSRSEIVTEMVLDAAEREGWIERDNEENTWQEVASHQRS